jgi:broad specificity phosphatase PhoE
MADPPRKLVLVRHSAPEIAPGVPASQWRLSDEGRLRCEALAAQLATYELGAVVTSTEPKAVETGQIVARILRLPIESAPGLHEQARPEVGLLASREQFQARVASVFEHPDQLVFGSETGDEAHARFTAAVDAVLRQHPDGNLVIVSHGTVITLFVAHATGVDPIPFWKSLGLPAFVVLSLPELNLLEVVESAT